MGRLFLVTLEGKTYSCKHCKAHLALCDDIVSKFSSNLSIFICYFWSILPIDLLRFEENRSIFETHVRILISLCKISIDDELNSNEQQSTKMEALRGKTRARTERFSLRHAQTIESNLPRQTFFLGQTLSICFIKHIWLAESAKNFFVIQSLWEGGIARAYNERMEGEFGGSLKILGSFYYGGFENY